MPIYLLPETIHLCKSGGQIVILDLARDQYLALDAAQARSMARIVPGWPVPDDNVMGGSSDAGDASAMALDMSARGLLTTDRARGKSAEPVDIAEAAESLIEAEVGHPLTLCWRHVAVFAAAASTAAFKLRWTPIASVVRKVMSRRDLPTGRAETPETEAVRALVDVFFRLRPFFFTASNACLFDSLALIYFLAHFGHFPRWIFGVQTAPFAAHCWVQHCDVVFNDSVEHVRRYTPILAA